jgi:prophage antirepressor-like protein
MNGVNFDATRNKYDYIIDGKHNRSIDVHKLCELNRVNMLGKNSDSVKLFTHVCKKVFQYQKKYIVSFWYDNNGSPEPLFDIKHIIQLLSVKDSQMYNIMKQIRNENKSLYFESNEFGGYIVRELIDEKTMYQIVLDSRSEFSKSFKSDVSDMLISLRKSGNIQLTNTTIPKQRQRKVTIEHSNISEIFMNDIIQVVNGGMKTTNDDNMEYVENLIKKGENIRLASYANDHVMYFLITNILSNKEQVICKIGYTSNIYKRMNSLVSEYHGSKFHLIGLKKIRNISDEENFHSMLKSRYSQLVYNDLTRKDELYVFDKCIWEEFTAVQEFHSVDTPIQTSSISVLNGILEEYKNGNIDIETMKIMLNVLQNCVELEKTKCDSQY